MISYNMDNNWKYIVEDNINDKGGGRTLRWEVYKKDKEHLIKIEFLVDVTYPKGGKIV